MSAPESGRRRRSGRESLTAATADRQALYQQAVQNPEPDIELAERIFRGRFGRRPLRLREDFCGSGLFCADWVRNDPERRATGVDLDAQVLAWGRAHNLDQLGGGEAQRVSLVCRDVRTPDPERHEVIVAFNYSYSVFRTRAELGAYFLRAREALEPEGLFLLDCFGGWEAQQVRRERRRLRGFTYVWEQAEYNPIDGHLVAHIHFEFPDGSRLAPAFSYDWRLWTLPELRELLAEAGFGAVDVYWEGSTPSGRGDGRFARHTQVGNDPRWNAYLVAFPHAAQE